VSTRTVRIAVNGVTGRMGYRQHLTRSLLAIRADGGVPLRDGTRVLPEVLLVGRDERKLADIARRHDIEAYTTSLDEALGDPSVDIYFDSLVTTEREKTLTQAIEAGKHVYTEKPTAMSLDGALQLATLARTAGIKHGVVQDKLFLPGLIKLRSLLDSGFFGRVLAVRGEFGYWVFEGDWRPAQRPSWNYRKADGGGIVADMFCHWRYVLDHVIAPVRAVTSRAVTHVPNRIDERGEVYAADADDAAYAIFELDGGVIATMNSSWVTRVYRDELLTLQVDGTLGSAVAGLHGCAIQSRDATPMPVWNPDEPSDDDFRSQWQPVPQIGPPVNAFRRQWELFLAHVVDDTPFPWDLVEGAKGVQLAEAGLESSRTGQRIELPEVHA
jgi:predicted dehydrogenase